MRRFYFTLVVVACSLSPLLSLAQHKSGKQTSADDYSKLSKSELLEAQKEIREQLKEAQGPLDGRSNRSGNGRSISEQEDFEVQQLRRQRENYLALSKELKRRERQVLRRVEPLPKRPVPESLGAQAKVVWQARESLMRAENEHLHSLGMLTADEIDQARAAWREAHQSQIQSARELSALAAAARPKAEFPQPSEAEQALREQFRSADTDEERQALVQQLRQFRREPLQTQ